MFKLLLITCGAALLKALKYLVNCGVWFGLLLRVIYSLLVFYKCIGNSFTGIL